KAAEGSQVSQAWISPAALSRRALRSSLLRVFIRVICVYPRLVHCPRILPVCWFSPCRGGSQRITLASSARAGGVHMLHNEDRRIFAASSSVVDTFVQIGRISKNGCLCIT